MAEKSLKLTQAQEAAILASEPELFGAHVCPRRGSTIKALVRKGLVEDLARNDVPPGSLTAAGVGILAELLAGAQGG